MGELLPLTLGLVLGTAVGLKRPDARVLVVALLAVPLGVLATVVTGEFRTSWGYILVDVPLVAVAAAAGAIAARLGRPERETT